jgi:hypothetical protein
MNTELLSPDTHEALNPAYAFAKTHSQVMAICELLDKSIAKVKGEIEDDGNNFMKSDLDRMECKVESIRKSTDLAECYDLLKGIFSLYDFISHPDQLWHFSHFVDRAFDQLENELYRLHDILDEYGVHEDIKPE